MKKHCFLSLLVGGFIFASCSSDKDMLIEEQQSTVKKMDWLYKMEWFILINLFLGLFMMI